MKYYPSTTACIITSEETGPVEHNATFHCVRMHHQDHGRIVAIVPHVGSDADQRMIALVIADALEDA